MPATAATSGCTSLGGTAGAAPKTSSTSAMAMCTSAKRRVRMRSLRRQNVHAIDVGNLSALDTPGALFLSQSDHGHRILLVAVSVGSNRSAGTGPCRASRPVPGTRTSIGPSGQRPQRMPWGSRFIKGGNGAAWMFSSRAGPDRRPSARPSKARGWRGSSTPRRPPTC